MLVAIPVMNCLLQVDDGALEADGDGGYRLKPEMQAEVNSVEYGSEGLLFRPCVEINNLVEEVRELTGLEDDVQ